MSGHAILDSCHNCGKEFVHLNVMHVSSDSATCQEATEKNGKVYHHIHIVVACDDCKKNIWDK